MTNKAQVLVPGRSSLPATVERRTQITNRLLGELTSRDTEAFFRRHPEFFRLVVSRYYPLNEQLIERYADLWDWEQLSKNHWLLWNERLITKFSNYWYWEGLSKNEALPWTKEFVEKFKFSWSWNAFSLNESLPYNQELISFFMLYGPGIT